jgi:hypothetical protein
MPSTIFEAITREYVNEIPIIKTYNSVQSTLLIGAVLVLGATAGYVYLTGLPANTERVYLDE